MYINQKLFYTVSSLQRFIVLHIFPINLTFLTISSETIRNRKEVNTLLLLNINIKSYFFHRTEKNVFYRKI